MGNGSSTRTSTAEYYSGYAASPLSIYPINRKDTLFAAWIFSDFLEENKFRHVFTGDFAKYNVLKLAEGKETENIDCNVYESDWTMLHTQLAKRDG